MINKNTYSSPGMHSNATFISRYRLGIMTSIKRRSDLTR